MNTISKIVAALAIAMTLVTGTTVTANAKQAHPARLTSSATVYYSDWDVDPATCGNITCTQFRSRTVTDADAHQSYTQVQKRTAPFEARTPTRDLAWTPWRNV